MDPRSPVTAYNIIIIILLFFLHCYYDYPTTSPTSTYHFNNQIHSDNNYWPLPFAGGRSAAGRLGRTARTTARPATTAAAPYRTSFRSPTRRPAYHTSLHRPSPMTCACVSARARSTGGGGGGSDDDNVPTFYPPASPFVSATAANHCSRAVLAP